MPGKVAGPPTNNSVIYSLRALFGIAMSTVHHLPTIFILALIAVTGPVFAATPDGSAVLETLKVSPDQVRHLENGGVLTLSGKQWERTDRELASDAAVLINKPLEEVLTESLEGATLVPSKKILDIGVVKSEADFAGVDLQPHEIKEARKILDAEPGDDLNFSVEEIAMIRQLAATIGREATDKDILAAASEAMRRLLAGRYRTYMESGLSGIAPYQRSKRKFVAVGDELRLTTDTLIFIKEHFPVYFDALLNFPEDAGCCEHDISWVKIRVMKRPAFTLIHRVTLTGEDYAVITERFFYASHTLNSAQITIGWLPYGDSTLMGLATSASADILTGFVGKALRLLGRNKADEIAGGVLTDIKTDVESDADKSAGESQPD